MPKVFLGSFNVSGVNRSDLTNSLDKQFRDFASKPLVLFVNDGVSSEKIEISLRDLGVNYDVDGSTEQVYQLGRSGGFAQNFWFLIRSAFVKTTAKPVYYVDSGKFASTLDVLLAKHLRSPADATIEFGQSFQIRRELNGKTYNREVLAETIRNKVESFSENPITINFVEVDPVVVSANATKALEKVKTLDKERISLIYDRETWSLQGESLLRVLTFVPKGYFGESFFVLNTASEDIVLKSVTLPDSREKELDVSLDKDYLVKFLDDIGSQIDVATVNATLVFDGEKVTQFTPARDGQKLDRKLAQKLILDKVSVENASGEKEIVINLPVTVTKAKIANDEINSLGIRELVGKGISYFGGSIANRIYNLSLGSQRINGTIIKPGEVFSFNRTVGEVSGATGYKPAYVISSGRTVLDDGGGMCQVSTTVFRAALNAGLPIVARTAHAYRVGYYEQGGFRAGLDATVWAPAVDLVFKNDTENSILVQAIVDAPNAKLEVDIYGTNDGRKVEVSNPVISNVVPAPADKHQDDPSLPKGTVKQVDFAAQGATSVFTRKVYKGDNLVIDESFKSNYRPWQAVYLVGTGG